MARRKKKKVAAKVPITSLKVECSLRETTEFGSILLSWYPNEKRLGRYSGSYWQGVPKKRYPVLAQADGDFDSYLDEGLSLEEVAWGCVNFLNTPPPRKKYARRTPKPLYGELDLVRVEYRKGEEGKPYLLLVMTTEKLKNRYFWGEGLQL